MSLPIAVADTSVMLAAFRLKDDRHHDGVAAFQTAQIKVVSPLVLAELDYLLMTRAGERAAVDAVASVRAMASVGQIRIPTLDHRLLGEAEQLLRTYYGHRLGLADAVNACLAWRLSRPVVLSFDKHYSTVLAPRHPGERELETIPGPR